MSFSLTFHSILDHNIRHLYSGTPTNVSYRHSKEYPNMDQLRQQRENQYLKDYVLRVSEYRSEHKCFIPRAPAFKALSHQEVDEIVTRLSSQTVASQGISGTSENTTLSDKRSKYPKYQGQKKVSREEMDAIVKRLNKPTTMSDIRDVKTATGLPEVTA
ncbi:uncharacterized protein LOC121384734 [Gigantopelta aegis]|uniref:uncharacterized protein LOC121384734 n=1 Tax=Gigantopelta aegis TaxID=1735272 RepID=UPI001B888C21|nr:uncharacterized protein LOC121384734 [Gigantopelta aegis]